VINITEGFSIKCFGVLIFFKFNIDTLYMAKRRSSSRSKNLSMLNNKWVLYLLSVVGIAQIVTYGMEQKWESTITFVVLGLLAHNYTKNMIIVLLVAIVGATLFSHFNKNNEGFNQKEEEDEEDLEEFSGNDTHDSSNYVDKAATMSKNLENIKSIVGKGGIEKMTKETAALMKQQNKMLENMEKLRPITEQAAGLVNQLENSNLVKTMATNKAKFQNASKQLGGLKNIV